MPGHDTIVMGASAGGVEALVQVVRALPEDLPAAVFVVLHLPAAGPSVLPQILSRAGPLPAHHALDGEAIASGRIYVAPPDVHLLVRPGHVHLAHGPRENGFRPALDPLFRTAARAYGQRVVAVVLSGTLDDGIAGLIAVKQRGGVAVVQDPEDAEFPDMPRRALAFTGADYVLPVAAIGPLLARLATEPVAEPAGGAAMVTADENGEALARRDLEAQARGLRGGQVSVYTCPSCGGSLWETEVGGLVHFNCHVGHRYSPEAFLAGRSEALEDALWTCLRMLVEKATFTRELAGRLRRAGQAEQAARLDEAAALDERHVRVLREQLLEAMPSPTSQAYPIGETLTEEK